MNTDGLVAFRSAKLTAMSGVMRPQMVTLTSLESEDC